MQMNALSICVGTSRNESYVRISTAAENGLLVIQTKNITLGPTTFFHKRHLWHVGRQLAVVLLYILHQKSVFEALWQELP